MLCVVTCFVHSQFLLVRGVKPKCKSYLFLLIIYLAIIFKPGTFLHKVMWDEEYMDNKFSIEFVIRAQYYCRFDLKY